MKPVSYLAIGLGLGFFQGSLEVAWSLGGPAPDILLLYVIWLGLQRETGCALWVAFLGGMIQDSVAYTQAMGIQSLCKVVAAYLPEWAHFFLLPENRMTGILLVIAGTLCQQVIRLTLVQTFEPGGVFGSTAFYQTLGLLFWNLLLWVAVGQRLLPSRPVEVIP
jgi:cell shape-determining protein MreD